MQEVEKKDEQQKPKPDAPEGVSGGVVDGGCIPDPWNPPPDDYPRFPGGLVDPLTGGLALPHPNETRRKT
jgi:hypothetical protein